MRYLDKKSDSPFTPEQIYAKPIDYKLANNIADLNQLFNGCSDFVKREISFAQPPMSGLVAYFDGLVNKMQIEENLLKSLFWEAKSLERDNNCTPAQFFDILKARFLAVSEVKVITTMGEVSNHLCSGDTVFIMDGSKLGLVVGTREWKTRSIGLPENESSVFGPNEAFSETLRFNTAMIRRRLKTSQLKIENISIGSLSKTDVCLCYVNNIAPNQLVETLRKRLSNINIDAILDTGYLAELLSENRYTVFSQVLHTERPDRVCGFLLEGKACLLVDGSPMALVLPISFPQFINASDDYYVNYIPASLFRFLRIAALFISLLLPSLYVAMISYHHEMIPTPLLFTIAASRQGVPFPAFIEALLLECTFELLREAGLRLPRAVGSAVSIVGALIIGDAAVRAGLVSTPMVVVIAFTGISSFVIPSYNAGIIIRIIRFLFLFSSGMFGFLGIMSALIILIIRMSSISSYGLPYLSPFAPFENEQITDILVRRPWFRNYKRPWQKGMVNQIRYKDPIEESDE